MAYTAAKGHTMLMPSGTEQNPDNKHLFIVCTDACSAGQHLIVSITSWTNHLCDPTTKLSPGCHKFVRKDSYIFFRKARIESGAILSAGVDGGQFVPNDPLNPQLLAAVLKGICDSIQTPRKIKKYANC